MSGRRLISTGSPFEETAGYSRALVHGDWCFVSGTTGYDYTTMTMPISPFRSSAATSPAFGPPRPWSSPVLFVRR